MPIVSCDACLGSALEENPAWRRRGRPLATCRNCGLVIASAPPGIERRSGCPRRDARHDARRAAGVGRLLPHGRILEVGCGEGHFLAALDPSRYLAVGVEQDAEAAARARDRLEKAGTRGTVITGTLTEAKLEPESFDMVVMFGSLPRSPSPRALLMETVRLLRAGGHALIEVPSLSSLTARLLGARWAPLHDPEARYFFTIACLERLTRSCGLLAGSKRTALPAGWPAPGTIVYTARKSARPLRSPSIETLTERVRGVSKATPLGAAH